MSEQSVYLTLLPGHFTILNDVTIINDGTTDLRFRISLGTIYIIGDNNE